MTGLPGFTAESSTQTVRPAAIGVSPRQSCYEDCFNLIFLPCFDDPGPVGPDLCFARYRLCKRRCNRGGGMTA